MADVYEIMKLRASPGSEDWLAWGPGRLGHFSVKSEYELAFEEVHRETAVASSTNPSGERACWSHIWTCSIPPIVRNFAWRLATNSLPSWQRKNRIGLETSEVAPICAREIEDNFHPFLECLGGRQLYAKMASVWSLPEMNSIDKTGTEWLFQVLEPLGQIARCMLLMTLWMIWFVWNEVVHNKPAPPVEVSARFLQSYLDSILGIKRN